MDNRTIGLLVGVITAVVAAVVWVPSTRTPDVPAADAPAEPAASEDPWAGVSKGWGDAEDWTADDWSKPPPPQDPGLLELFLRPAGTEEMVEPGSTIKSGSRFEVLMRSGDRGYGGLIAVSNGRMFPVKPTKGDTPRVVKMAALQRIMRSFVLEGEGTTHLFFVRCEETFDLQTLESAAIAAVAKVDDDGMPAQMRNDCVQASTWVKIAPE